MPIVKTEPYFEYKGNEIPAGTILPVSDGYDRAKRDGYIRVTQAEAQAWLELFTTIVKEFEDA